MKKLKKYIHDVRMCATLLHEGYRYSSDDQPAYIAVTTDESATQQKGNVVLVSEYNHLSVRGEQEATVETPIPFEHRTSPLRTWATCVCWPVRCLERRLLCRLATRFPRMFAYD